MDVNHSLPTEARLWCGRGAETVSEGVVPDGHPIGLTGEQYFCILGEKWRRLR